jgi:mannose-6-phosphate isomerase
MTRTGKAGPLADQLLVPLEPQYKERVWGGRRLRLSKKPIGEAWLAFGDSRVQRGPSKGLGLDEVIASGPEAILGTGVVARYGRRFPLLIKLLDCAQWLSLQVHPNDEQARRMVGLDQQGKTEAWYVLDADPHARILLGVKPGTTAPALAAAIREGRALDVAAEVEVHPGEAVLIPAGTLHAIGPGLLLYEIQQASDITFRAYDWDRPQTDSRRLHIEESAQVARPVGPLARTIPLVTEATGSASAVECGFFRLELASVGETPLQANTLGRSCHVVTVIDGAVEVACAGRTAVLQRPDTIFIAAAAGEYEVAALQGPARLLRASVPD